MPNFKEHFVNQTTARMTINQLAMGRRYPPEYGQTEDPHREARLRNATQRLNVLSYAAHSKGTMGFLS